MKHLLLYWIGFTFLVVGVHLWQILIQEKSPDKGLWLTIRVTVGVLFVLAEYSVGLRNPIVYGPAYFFTGFFLHNTLIALGMGKKLWYLNNTGPIDRALRSIAFPAWVILGILAGGLIGAYFLNEF